MDPTRIIEEGYDRIARAYASGRAWFDNAREIEEFASCLPAGARVLDAGCGAGVPITRDLTDRGFVVTGVDVSREMLALAQTNVPNARFFRANMTELHFDDNIFDGLVCSYSLFHVPRDRHEEVFRTFHRILKDEGHLLISLGAREWEETKDYMGAPMFWSHFSPAKTLNLLKNAGFEVQWERKVVTGGETHIWTLARQVPPQALYSLIPPVPPPWQVYVLECEDGSYYTGVTNNLENRLKLHQTGKGAKYTRSHPPKKVLLTLPAQTRAVAQQMEIWLKERHKDVKVTLIASGADKTMESWKRYCNERDGSPATYPWQKQAPKKKNKKKTNKRNK